MDGKNQRQDPVQSSKVPGSPLALLPEEGTPPEKVWLEKEKLLVAILDSIAEGVFTIDFNMRITSFNRAAEKITGYPAHEAIGRQCMDVFCNSGRTEKDCLLECPMKKTIKYNTPITKKRTIYNKNGEILIVSGTTNLLFDLNNQPIGGVETFIDITAFERLKEKWQGKKYNMGDIVGKSPQMAEIYQLIESISEVSSTVLIQGETGTGKGIVATAIHYQSKKHKGPFVHVNCAAIPESLLESELFGHVKGAFTGAFNDRQGKFEQAHKGTIFLDEIGDLSQGMQAKLLRVVEDKRFEKVGGSKTTEVDVRIIAATNKNLDEDISAKKFREDLFFRLNTIPLVVPPLREHMEDIPLLVEHFVEKLNFKMGKTIKRVSPEIFDIFLRHSWPGNVRELESVLEYAFIRCDGDYLETSHLQPRYRLPAEETIPFPLGVPGSSETLQIPEKKPQKPKPSEREILLRALEDCHWNRTRAAKQLNISRTTLWREMKSYGLL